MTVYEHIRDQVKDELELMGTISSFGNMQTRTSRAYDKVREYLAVNVQPYHVLTSQTSENALQRGKQ